MRINKYLSSAGVCSRREADRLIESKKVLINGEIAGLGSEVNDTDRVFVDGKEVEFKNTVKDRVILAFNKPVGFVCSNSSTQGRSIFEIIDYPKRLFYVGRLDKMSRGLLLLSNDGDFANSLMKAKNAHEREYIVRVDKEITPEFLKKMRNGVYLRDLEKKTRPCFVEQTDKKEFRIILTQGLNRQIRRMCGELGQHVQDLCRIRIENITLGNLKEGNLRKISGSDKESLLATIK